MNIVVKRLYKRWSQPGISDAIHIARSTFVSSSSTHASVAQASRLSSPNELGQSLAEIMDELSGFLEQRVSNQQTNTATSGQSIVLSGVCQLAKDNTNGLKGIISLPTPIQLAQKILVFASPEHKDAALRAGADIVGGAELLDEVLENKLQFDRVVATQDMLPLVMKLARVLGPKGLMPSAKAGSLTDDVGKAVRELRTNVSFRIEKFSGVFSFPIAKSNNSAREIEGNVRATLEHLLGLGQSKVKKGCFIKKVCLATHGGFSRQIAQSEYWSKPKKTFGKIQTASIPENSTVPVNKARNSPT